MTIRKIIGLTAVVALGGNLAACSTATKALGLKQSAPNEFNILTKAPLVVPPEYNLRPPRVGESSSANNYTQEAARKALIGDIDDVEPSKGEISLLHKAGAPRANPEIRVEIDGQNSVERKTDSLTSRILFWNNGRGANPDGTPLDPETEAKRLEAIGAATGGGQVTITRKPGGAKLPGL